MRSNMENKDVFYWNLNVFWKNGDFVFWEHTGKVTLQRELTFLRQIEKRNTKNNVIYNMDMTE